MARTDLGEANSKKENKHKIGIEALERAEKFVEFVGGVEVGL